VTVRNLRELEIYQPADFKVVQPWPQLIAEEPNAAQFSTDLHSIQGYGTRDFRPSC
jgi:hypothetical protein